MKKIAFINIMIIVILITIIFCNFLEEKSNAKMLVQDETADVTLEVVKDNIDMSVEDKTAKQVSLCEKSSETNTKETQTEKKNDITVESEIDKENSANNQADIENTINNMTLEEKVAQLFIITPEALTDYVDIAEAGEMTRDALNRYHVGGIIYFEKNILDYEQTKNMLENVQNYNSEFSDIPLFLCVDEEGGRIGRIANNPNFDIPRFPDMIDVGKSEDISKAYDVGYGIGSYLKELGFNVDFAPVADVLSNTENTIVQTRSFGSDARLVSDMARDVARGLNDNNIIASFKHFPGHGATLGDTHQGYSYTDKTLDELMQNELIPFKDAINNGADMIMIGHISVPNVTGDDVPSSLSEKVIGGILRTQLGFDGVVITDALNMTAVTSQYDSAQVAIMTINAGADLILMPSDFYAAYEGLIEAVKSQAVSEERINESLRRILKLKVKYF